MFLELEEGEASEGGGGGGGGEEGERVRRRRRKSELPVAVAENWETALSVAFAGARASLPLRLLQLRPSCTHQSHLRVCFSPFPEEEKECAEERRGRARAERGKEKRSSMW